MKSESDPSVRLLPHQQRHTKKQLRRKVFGVSCVFVWTAVILVAVIAVVIVFSKLDFLPDDPQARANALLSQNPVIDGHNDLAYQIRATFMNQLDQIDLEKNTSGTNYSEWHTDIPRLKAGLVGSQFWSAYMPCSSQFKDATRAFIDQIDIIRLFVQKYSDTFMFATSVSDIETAFRRGHIASMIGVEGGHAIDSSLATLRQLYNLGARYLTLTHTCNTLWAHSSTDDSSSQGLNDFGKAVVLEMNRLGMIVDISHVNVATMKDALETSKAPVMFSHSSARALCDNPRNVPDDVLDLLVENKGIVMVNFYSNFINCTDPNEATLEQVADHIDHIRSVAGVDYVGIGSDFDGIGRTPKGLEDVSKYPFLFAELIRRGYSDEEIKKISRQNLIRVFKAVEEERDALAHTSPDNKLLRPQPNETCRPDF